MRQKVEETPRFETKVWRRRPLFETKRWRRRHFSRQKVEETPPFRDKRWRRISPFATRTLPVFASICPTPSLLRVQVLTRAGHTLCDLDSLLARSKGNPITVYNSFLKVLFSSHSTPFLPSVRAHSSHISHFSILLFSSLTLRVEKRPYSLCRRQPSCLRWAHWAAARSAVH